MNIISAFIRIIRLPNILMIALAQWAFHRFIIYPSFDANFFPLTLQTKELTLLILATAFIGAAGNVINDFFDMDLDTQFKPERVIVGKAISEEGAQNLFYILNGIGLACGVYLCYLINQKQLISVFVLSIVLLWFYSAELKKTPLLGNLVISFLCAFSIILVWLFERGLFDLVAYDEMKQITAIVYYSMLAYAGSAFLINLTREIVKDFEDSEGDFRFGANTLPIFLGARNAKIFLLILNIAILAFFGYSITLFSFEKHMYHIGYIIGFLIIPMLINIYFSIVKSEYTKASLCIKITIFFGVLSIPLFYFLNNQLNS